MIRGKRLEKDFYQRLDVTNIARELLGKLLVTHLEGSLTSGIIVETEAYRAPEDKASHAYNGRRTTRTETMYLQGGHSYVYLCYGIHHLFNVVTGPNDVAHAVLIRAIEPIEGAEVMIGRRSMQRAIPRLTSGPGSMSKAMGIDMDLNALDLTNDNSPVWIESGNRETINTFDIIESPRVGVDYAEECASWPWRYRIRGNRWTSPAK